LPHTAILREASSCSRWEQTPWNLGTLSPKWDDAIKPLPSGLKELWMRKKVVRPRETKETVSSRHNRVNTHMNSHRLRQHAQGLHRFKPDGPSAMRGEVDASPHA